MTTLVHNLGLVDTLAFHDVFSISEPELLAFVPRPALALLLVFPISESYEQFRRQEDEGKPEYQDKGDGEDPVWFKQTIRNACGMIGVLHAISNGAARDMIGMLFLYCFPAHRDHFPNTGVETHRKINMFPDIKNPIPLSANSSRRPSHSPHVSVPRF